MYSGNDLVTLMTALDALTADGLYDYDLNVGQVIPYLKISISRAQIASFPAIQTLALTQPLMQIYYTIDFTPAVADFITSLQAACTTYATTKLPVWQAYYDHAVTFQSFLTSLASKK